MRCAACLYAACSGTSNETRVLPCRHRPERTLYLAFGHDEEVSGRFGAMQMAQMLTQQGVQLEFVMDEGGTVLTDGLKGLVEEPLALVGTAEKVGMLKTRSQKFDSFKRSPVPESGKGRIVTEGREVKGLWGCLICWTADRI